MTNCDVKSKNDWAQDDDDDDTWDDWGDAEDNATATSTTKTEPATTRATSRENYNNKRNDTSCNKNTGPSTPTQEQETPNTEGKSSWGSLWGAVMSTATDLTSTVSQGLNQVIGVPEPEELARFNAEEQKSTRSEENGNAQSNATATPTTSSTPTTPVFGLGLVSGVTTLGSKVLNTGLDTLEGIGKKTMDILQENDPLLKKKRKLLGLEADRPNLSEILKEAKKDADDLENTLKDLQIEKTREQLRFDVIFENKCGLVHLEALEILSSESTLKLHSLLDSVSGRALRDLQETMNEVKELLELEDLEGESEGDYNAQQLNTQLLAAIEDADISIDFADIISNWTQTLEWLAVAAAAPSTLDSDPPSADELQQQTLAKGITALAETCALEMCKLHKIAELLLVKEHHSTATEVDSIVQLCKQFITHLHGLTNRYATALAGARSEQSEETKTKLSRLFAELLMATQQIEKAFKLFAPILQIGAV